MGLWDKVKDAAQKAAEAAKDQVGREDSLLNKTMDGARRAADKATVVAKDQMNRQDSALNRARASVAKTSDSVLGKIDEMDSNTRADSTQAAKRYAAKRKIEALGDLAEADPDLDLSAAPPPDDEAVRFPNAMEWTDEQVYKKVAETIYPDFRTLPAGDKKWALCEIARYDKKIVDLMRAIGSAYDDTVRQLAQHDDGYKVALEAAGLAGDRDLEQAYRAWLDDAFDEEFYADDDGGHAKSTRLLGWLVFSRVGGSALEVAFADAGVRDRYRLAAKLGAARELVDAREDVIEKHFRPRRASFTSQFLVQKGINADVHFAWLDPAGSGSSDDDDDSGNDGGSQPPSDDDSPFEI